MMRAPSLGIMVLAALAFLGVLRAAAPELADSPSAFIRAQAASSVQWHAWNEANLAKAQMAGKSVYVFVGSDLSELSRATLRETFARPETVAWLNENFFCLLVDADLQPEVAAYAQHFISSARQLRGWPVHLWLTPDLQPYDGANYLPPTEEWGRPGFLKSARAALEAWTTDPARARAMAAEAREQMQSAIIVPTGNFDLEARLAKATAAWIAAADRKNGGFGVAPKHPEPELIRFLLMRGPEAQAVAIAAARTIVNGGLRDPKDGGFFRRTIDAEWKEPYRQKLLSDQARIALALYEAGDAAKDDSLRAAGDGALRFVLGQLRREEGFAAGWDGTVAEPRGAVGGSASAGSEGLLLAALARSTDSKLQAEGKNLAAGAHRRLNAGLSALVHALGSPDGATAGDMLALALGLRGGKNADASARLAALRLERDAMVRYFDQRSGQYMASQERLPAGIVIRVPTLADPLPAEVLALLAGTSAETANKLRRSLHSQIEYDELPSGAVLLALARGKDSEAESNGRNIPLIAVPARGSRAHP